MNHTVIINGRNYDPKTYGGDIREADFEYMSASMATSRILSAICFDLDCRKRKENKDAYKLNLH